jgi:enoyl-CoA hydratase/carnithine racemase
VILELRIDRPERRNALDTAAVARFTEQLAHAENDPAARAVIVYGGGEVAFCAGQDTKESASMDRPARRAAHLAGQAMMAALAAHPCLTIAAIEGFCLGGGLELALACDVRIAGDGATFGLPEVGKDMLPTWGAHHRLSHVVGLGRAKELLLLGRRLTAREAVEWGLVAVVTPSGEALRTAHETAAAAVTGVSRQTLATAKQLLAAGQLASTGEAMLLDQLAEASLE